MTAARAGSGTKKQKTRARTCCNTHEVTATKEQPLEDNRGHGRTTEIVIYFFNGGNVCVLGGCDQKKIKINGERFLQKDISRLVHVVLMKGSGASGYLTELQRSTIILFQVEPSLSVIRIL